jgi:CheY-specific phosphatase CheX
MVTGIHLQAGSRESNKELGDITGVMYLHGKKDGVLFVTANVDDIRILCSSFIGVSPEEVTEDDLDDLMCEVVNMTAGNAKLRFGDTDYMFSLLQPFVIKGKDVSIVTKSITHVEAGTLTDGEISVSYKVIY